MNENDVIATKVDSLGNSEFVFKFVRKIDRDRYVVSVIEDSFLCRERGIPTGTEFESTYSLPTLIPMKLMHDLGITESRPACFNGYLCGKKYSILPWKGKYFIFRYSPPCDEIGNSSVSTKEYDRFVTEFSEIVGKIAKYTDIISGGLSICIAEFVVRNPNGDAPGNVRSKLVSIPFASFRF